VKLVRAHPLGKTCGYGLCTSYFPSVYISLNVLYSVFVAGK
jgi:hypothetical protein